MPLYWIVKTIDGEPRVFLQEAGTKLFATLRAELAGHKGEPGEAHELDVKTARKVPKKMIGRVLTAKEARTLLKKLGA